MLPASLSATGPLALPLFAPTAIVVFGATVMDMVPPVLAGVTVIICLLSHSRPVPVSVAVVAPGLVRHRRRRRVGGILGLLWLVTVVLVPVTRLNNQRPVEVGHHVGPDVEGRRQTETLLRVQLTVEGLTARPVLPPKLVGPLLPH